VIHAPQENSHQVRAHLVKTAPQAGSLKLLEMTAVRVRTGGIKTAIFPLLAKHASMGKQQPMEVQSVQLASLGDLRAPIKKRATFVLRDITLTRQRIILIASRTKATAPVVNTRAEGSHAPPDARTARPVGLTQCPAPAARACSARPDGKARLALQAAIANAMAKTESIGTLAGKIALAARLDISSLLQTPPASAVHNVPAGTTRLKQRKWTARNAREKILNE
jgi:hypothetical protein